MQATPQISKAIGCSYKVEESLILESGDILRDLRIHYTTLGELNVDKSNVVWVFHALTANSNPLEWWPGVIGNIINPKDHFIICANMLGSCYGSTEPTDLDFPLVTIYDMVKSFQLLRNHLSIDKIKIGIGGSMGGQQLLEWAVQEPDLFEIIIPIATNAKHSAWGIAFNEVQRMAIRQNPISGIEIARSIAMLSYRHYNTFAETQADIDERISDFSASTYQRYQGLKLRKRFSPYSYFLLSQAMDSHNIGRHYGGVSKALARIKAKAIVIGIESDLLFPIREQKLIAYLINKSSFYAIQSLYGHDGFLMESEQLNEILKNELND